MTTLTLVDPQPMETLPEKDVPVFVLYDPKDKEPFVVMDNTDNVRLCMKYRMKFHAWSRTATFGEGV